MTASRELGRHWGQKNQPPPQALANGAPLGITRLLGWALKASCCKKGALGVPTMGFFTSASA